MKWTDFLIASENEVKESSPNVLKGSVTQQGRDFSYGTVVGVMARNGAK